MSARDRLALALETIPAPLAAMLASWRRHLQAANKSPRTIQTYLDSGVLLAQFLVSRGMPDDVARLTAEHVEEFIADQLRRHSPATASVRYRALQQFFRWLTDIEREIAANPMARLAAPHVPETPPPVIDDHVLRRLLKACEGRDFRDRRDLAIVRLLIDTGARRSELANLTLADLDLDQHLLAVVGKGRRPRFVPFGDKTATALDRYLRLRAKHASAGEPYLWLGHEGRLTSNGLYQAVKARADAAGLEGIHPHLFRHTAAHSWLVQGGQEGDLMRLMGWRSRTMLGRYGASAAQERAIEAHRKLKPGDRV